jgi:hypothetical protein
LIFGNKHVCPNLWPYYTRQDVLISKAVIYISAQRIMRYIACSRQIGMGDLISDLLSMVAALRSIPTYIGKA